MQCTHMRVLPVYRWGFIAGIRNSAYAFPVRSNTEALMRCVRCLATDARAFRKSYRIARKSQNGHCEPGFAHNSKTTLLGSAPTALWDSSALGCHITNHWVRTTRKCFSWLWANPGSQYTVISVQCGKTRGNHDGSREATHSTTTFKEWTPLSTPSAAPK